MLGSRQSGESSFDEHLPGEVASIQANHRRSEEKQLDRTDNASVPLLLVVKPATAGEHNKNHSEMETANHPTS